MQIRGDRLQMKRAPVDRTDDGDIATAREFLRSNRSLLALVDPDQELAVTQHFHDALGRRHVRFEQQLRGLPVWPDDLVVHLDPDGNADVMDGAYVPTPRISPAAAIVNPQTAADKARLEVTNSESARVTEPELIVYAPLGKSPRLAWRVRVTASIAESWSVVIDATNGRSLAAISEVMTENVNGSGRDLLGRTRTLNVWNQAGTYYMVDTSKPMFAPSSQPPDFARTRGAIFVVDARNTPPGPSPSMSDAALSVFYVTSSTPSFWTPPDAVSAAFGLSKTYDYYLTRQNRNSLDGNGGNIYAIVRFGYGYHNAVFNQTFNTMVFGDADSYAGSLDVVAHELTHGVTAKTAGLLYQDQSGALNEAMSDIFGEMTEAYAEGSNDWLMGSQLSAPIRSMSDPHQFGDPATMAEYKTTTQDSGGVHTNSGIINRAFYMLAQGLNGGIGLREAERIFYRALTTHLTSSSQFLDARLACVQSADELFGSGSSQSQATSRAFDSVDVLVPPPPPPPPTSTPGAAADSSLFVYRDGQLFLGRHEAALSDPAQGVKMSDTAVAETRPTVSGDGSLAFFVTSNNDACFIRTNASTSPSCLGMPGSIWSVAMSRDANLFALVLLDSTGHPDNQIVIVDLVADTTTTVTPVGGATDGGTPATVVYADAMDFSANRRYLLFDALNRLPLPDGTETGLWNISVYDFVSRRTYPLFYPLPGYDIGNPSVAKTSDQYFVFEVDDQGTGKVNIWAANPFTGAVQELIDGVASGPVAPVYTGDDRAIVYSYPTSTTTGRSLATEALSNPLTPVGDPSVWLGDAELAAVYRRGSYSGPRSACSPTSNTLCLGGRFQVSATYRKSSGQTGVGAATAITGDTGYFTFFSPTNVEVVVKVLNACSLNQRFWVFAGGLTNVGVVLTVTDALTGVTRTYGNPQSTAFLPVQDTGAFETCFVPSLNPFDASGTDAEGLLRPEAVSGGNEEARDGSYAKAADVWFATPEPVTAAGCVADSQTLCLSDGRFAVRTTWRKTDGTTGAGAAVRLTADTGYFWFFSSSNVEMIVKVLNACSISNRIWTFAGGLTNVGVTMAVTDTRSGVTKTYTNPLGTPFQPIQDTGAFATCP